ncbi:hypothetical protein C2G38_436753 [Gigaspora rosea]|uniref:PH domain-containing protein n=1 Tax=Gigaspora rosea TaxID=44941 RepID=A0A397UJP9_9GLOM|nr:hypothetical protein C2G38_436753 [Gigaspora rosea]
MFKIKSGITLNSLLFLYHRKYFSTFQQHNINLTLNKQTLKSFGVINEHRMIIIYALNTFKTERMEIGQLTFKNYTDYLVTIMEESPTDHHITSHVNVLVNKNHDDQAPSVTHKDNNELPSYFDVVKNKQELNYITIHEEEGCEILPSYSCSVFKAGYVFKKDEMISQGVKAKRRTWRKVYFYLWGTLLRIYKNEPLDINVSQRFLL